MKRILTLFVILLFTKLQASEIPKPIFNSYVHDFADVLTTEQEAQLQSQLVQLKQKYTIETAIVTIPSTGDVVVDDYTLELGREWGVGGKSNNGLVILTAINDRKWRVEVGYGLEGDLPDITTKQLAQEYLVPEFKEGDYYEGFSNLITQIDLKLDPEAKAIAEAEELKQAELWKEQKAKVMNFLIYFFQFVIFGLVVFSIWYYIKQRKKKKEKELERAKAQLKDTQACIDSYLQIFNNIIRKTKSDSEKEFAIVAKETWKNYNTQVTSAHTQKTPKKILEIVEAVNKYNLSSESAVNILKAKSILSHIEKIERLKTINLEFDSVVAERKNLLRQFEQHKLVNYYPEFKSDYQIVEDKQAQLVTTALEYRNRFIEARSKDDYIDANKAISKFNEVKNSAQALNQDLKGKFEKRLQKKHFVTNFDTNINLYLKNILTLASMSFVSDAIRNQIKESIKDIRSQADPIPRDSSGHEKLSELYSNLDSYFTSLFNEKRKHEEAVRKEEQAKKKAEEDRRRKKREEEEEEEENRRRSSSYYSSSSSSDSSSSSSSSDYSGGSFGGGGSSGDW